VTFGRADFATTALFPLHVLARVMSTASLMRVARISRAARTRESRYTSLPRLPAAVPVAGFFLFAGLGGSPLFQFARAVVR
jgi:hypothetical protein